MRLTQGCFSFLPNLTDLEIEHQICYIAQQGWACMIEHTGDPHPCNTYWEMYQQPLFDLSHTQPAMAHLQACRTDYPEHYIRLSAFNAQRGIESTCLSFIVHRPPVEPRFQLQRTEQPGRVNTYTLLRENASTNAPS